MMSISKKFSETYNSDFLVSDDKLMYRLVGLKWIRGIDICPVVSFISSPYKQKFYLEKQMIFKMGKRIYYNDKFSARLAHRYSVGEYIDSYEDLEETAILYARFL